MCDKNYIRLNGKYIKPSKIVKPGDLIEIETAKGMKLYKILKLPKGNVKKNERDLFYEEILK
jgi:ribosomal 50S subunit-recycling heat shock protein